MIRHVNTGTCSRAVNFELDADGVVTACSFEGGCPGNTVGVAKLAIGRKASELIPLLEGVPCRNGTSCPDQLAKALREATAGVVA